MNTKHNTPKSNSNMVEYDTMADDALIRIERLRALGLTAAKLSAQVGGLPSYWHSMLEGKKSFGEKIARKIEGALNLPRGHLDTPLERTDEAPLEPIEKPLTYADNFSQFSQMATELAIEFDLINDCDHTKRILHAHCMLLINRNPLLMRALGISTPADGDEPPSATPRHSQSKLPSRRHS